MQKWYASGGQEFTTNNELIQGNQNPGQLDVEMEPSCYTSFGSLPHNAMQAPDQETAAEAASNDLDAYMIGRSALADASCSSNNFITTDDYHGFAYDDWDELRSVVGCAFDNHPPSKQGHK
ncbi:hypothetical protein MLD38_034126 [Melastoma candidum]|nr:hypothetical protein MLD38_034126 [Melastoma candidum]